MRAGGEGRGSSPLLRKCQVLGFLFAAYLEKKWEPRLCASVVETGDRKGGRIAQRRYGAGAAHYAPFLPVPAGTLQYLRGGMTDCLNGEHV